MEIRSKVIKVALVGVAGLLAVVGGQVESEASSYRYLCTSAPGACEYAPSTAPVLNADVCFNGTTAVLKGAGDCAPGAWPYLVRAGEVVDPQTNEVQAYIPLDDACDMGYCLPKTPGDPPGEEGAMCCDPADGSCVATDGLCGSDQIAVWCDDGEVAELVENGEWECHESA